MTEWKKVKIDKLCNVVKGITGLAKATPGQYPLVTTGHKKKTCNEYQFDTKAVCIPLVSSTGHGKKTLNYVHYQEGKFALGTILTAVIPKDDEELDAKYLHLYLSFYKDRILVPLMRGAANVSLSIKDIKKICLPVPPINIQKSIIEKYYSVKPSSEKLLKLLNHQIIIFKQLRQAILQEAVEGKLTADWRKKHSELISGEHSAENLLKKIKIEKEQLIKEKKIKNQKSLLLISEEEKPFKLPEGWIWTRLGNIYNFKYGKGLSKIQRDNNGKYPVYGSNGIVGFYNKYLTEKRSIIIGRKGSCGEVNISTKPSWTTDVAYYIEENKNIRFYFSVYLLKSLNLPKYGTGVKPGINRKKVYSIIIAFPSFYEQKIIIEQVRILMKMIDELEKQVIERKEQATQLMHSVLREAFEQK